MKNIPVRQLAALALLRALLALACILTAVFMPVDWPSPIWRAAIGMVVSTVLWYTLGRNYRERLALDLVTRAAQRGKY